MVATTGHLSDHKVELQRQRINDELVDARSSAKLALTVASPSESARLGSLRR